MELPTNSIICGSALSVLRLRNARVCKFMTFLTKSNAVANHKPQGGIFSKWFNMMRLNPAICFPTILTGEIVSFKNSFSPTAIFGAFPDFASKFCYATSPLRAIFARVSTYITPNRTVIDFLATIYTFTGKAFALPVPMIFTGAGRFTSTVLSKFSFSFSGVGFSKKRVEFARFATGGRAKFTTSAFVVLSTIITISFVYFRHILIIVS